MYVNEQDALYLFPQDVQDFLVTDILIGFSVDIPVGAGADPGSKEAQAE